MRKLNKSSRRKKGGYLPKNLLEQNDDDGIPTNLYISSDEEDNEPVEEDIQPSTQPSSRPSTPQKMEDFEVVDETQREPPRLGRRRKKNNIELNIEDVEENSDNTDEPLFPLLTEDENANVNLFPSISEDDDDDYYINEQIDEEEPKISPQGGGRKRKTVKKRKTAKKGKTAKKRKTAKKGKTVKKRKNTKKH